MAKATLINQAGHRVVVQSGSQQAQQHFGQGYQLMGASGQWQAPVAPTQSPIATWSPQMATPQTTARPIAQPITQSQRVPQATPMPLAVMSDRASNLTPSNIYEGLNFETQEERTFRNQLAQQARATATTPIDEASIRSNTLARFQAEIDALNRVYAERKRVERIAGEGRMGSVAAVGARRGLIGSDFGIAQEREQEAANTDVINAIDSERAMKVQNILSEARRHSDREIEARTQAKRLGAENYLRFISESSARRQSNVMDIVRRIYAAGEGNITDWNEIAESLGVSVEALKSNYAAYKREQDAIALQKSAEEAKKAAEEARKEAKEAEAERIKNERALLKDGFAYVKTPAERDALRARGFEIVELGGRTYSRRPKTTTRTVKVGSTTYSITQDDMGNILNRSIIGRGGGGGVPTTPTNTRRAAEAEMTKAMGEVIGADGFISPNDYTTLRNQWIRAGFNPTDFDTNFKGFRNPNNPNYITIKQ